MDVLIRICRSRSVRPLVFGLLVCVLGLLLGRLGVFEKGLPYGAPGTEDLIQYWSAAKLLRNGENPYDHEHLHQVQRAEGSTREEPILMYNPPWLLVWLYPLLLLPFPTLALVWLYLSMAVILLGGTLVWRTCSGFSVRDRLTIPWLAAAIFIPVISTLRCGQVSAFLFLGVAGFWYFVTRGKDLQAGMFLAVTTIKPHVVYLLWIAVLWWVITERRWRVLPGLLIPLAPALLLLAWLWPNGLLGYQDILAHPPLHYITATLGGIFRLLVLPDPP
jgi:hypothetical protein